MSALVDTRRAGASAAATPRRAAPRLRPGSMVVTVVLIGFCVLALYPFVAMLFGSLQTSGDLSRNPGGIPDPLYFGNYADVFTGDSSALLWRSLLNSVIVTVPFTALTVLFCAMAGYAFARYTFPGSKVIFALLLMSMLVPSEINIPSLFVFFAQIDWLNSYQVQIFPGTASVLGMFMARQYMAGLPAEVFDAARVDGAGHWRTFWTIALPMSAPVLGAIAVLTSVNKWSDYLWPKVMVNDPLFQPIMVTLPSLATSQDGFIVRYEILLAGCVIVTIPLLIMFLKFQDNLMAGTTAGAVRG